MKNKCRSKCNDLASSIRNAIFTTFGEDRLEKVDNNTITKHLVEWKESIKTCNAYHVLFNDKTFINKISYTVFKSFRGKDLPNLHSAFILSIGDILLNPITSGIKCNDCAVAYQVQVFMIIWTLRLF